MKSDQSPTYALVLVNIFLFLFIFKVLVAAFIAEGMTVDFWLPLEAAAMENVPKLADLIDDMLSNDDWKCDVLCNTLRNTTTRYVVSYSLSIFFLMAVLHATRIIDLRVLDEGFGYFINDIGFKFKRFVKKQFKWAITKELDNSVTIDDEQIIKEVLNANPGSGGSFSDNNLEMKRKTPQKKRNKRITKAAPGNDGDRSDKSDADAGNSGKRLTRSSTCCSDKNRFCDDKLSVNRKSIF